MKVPAFTFVALLLVGPAWAQTAKPYSRAAAEKSFRALVAAKDSDIMVIVKNDGYVCFADDLPINKEDRFLTILFSKPNWLPEKSTDEVWALYDETKESPAKSLASLDFYEWENQDYNDVVTVSMLDGKWHSYGHFQRLKDGNVLWKPFGDIPPVFRFAAEKDEISGATNISAMQDGTTFYASKKYENKDKGTTTYEMNMRLSTGRYKETWTPDKDEPFESVGNCYKAKDYIHDSTSGKKK